MRTRRWIEAVAVRRRWHGRMVMETARGGRSRRALSRMATRRDRRPRGKRPRLRRLVTAAGRKSAPGYRRMRARWRSSRHESLGWPFWNVLLLLIYYVCLRDMHSGVWVYLGIRFTATLFSWRAGLLLFTTLFGRTLEASSSGE